MGDDDVDDDVVVDAVGCADEVDAVAAVTDDVVEKRVDVVDGEAGIRYRRILRTRSAASLIQNAAVRVNDVTWDVAVVVVVDYVGDGRKWRRKLPA